TPLKKYAYSGAAILNKDNGMKLVGYLNTKESFYANWITGEQEGFVLTQDVVRGNGTLSLSTQKLGRRIHVNIVNNQIQIEV
ncbi:Ger(x)C family spore germination C-terminal domain-containing protein, partial [Lysinibacillus sp. GbtcB16]|uniref:Ger(x)C family spore germination C-terminal domain-containing protein n=1 Tax=Lysinibacillus sp. GbtcB16 TaxID=2824761 RepID=UPI001C30C1D3